MKKVNNEDPPRGKIAIITSSESFKDDISQAFENEIMPKSHKDTGRLMWFKSVKEFEDHIRDLN